MFVFCIPKMIKLLGNFPKPFALSGKNSKKYFDGQGNLKRFKNLQQSSIK